MRLPILVATVTIMLGLCVIGTASYSRAQQGPGAALVSIDTNDIGGTVAGPSGPEAGVWVIAETLDLPTKFRKIVVTDDLGRYVVPDLPDANYRVWVRGYGLVDSAPVQGRPGQLLSLRAVPAPDRLTAAAGLHDQLKTSTSGSLS
jgi:hypothetical protein